jgi:hypothetical protein
MQAPKPLQEEFSAPKKTKKKNKNSNGGGGSGSGGGGYAYGYGGEQQPAPSAAQELASAPAPAPPPVGEEDVEVKPAEEPDEDVKVERVQEPDESPAAAPAAVRPMHFSCAAVITAHKQRPLRGGDAWRVPLPAGDRAARDAEKCPGADDGGSWYMSV